VRYPPRGYEWTLRKVGDETSPTLEFRSCAIAFASFTERRCPVVPAGDGRTRELEQALVGFSGGGKNKFF
jgi:hypothetical protein